MRPPPGNGFEWVDDAAGPALRCVPLVAIAPHVFTTRPWLLGSANGSVAAGWRQVAAAVGIAAERLARAHQVHGASVLVVRGAFQAEPLPDADVLITAERDAAVAVQTADCVPLLIADPQTRTVAAAHAGWRGLARRVPGVTVQALAQAFGAHPSNLIVAIGPAISRVRYEVGADVWNRFVDAGFSSGELSAWFESGRRPDHWQFDGAASARDQVIAAGVPADRVFVSTLCTATERDWLCSYRRDGTAAGRTAAAIRPR